MARATENVAGILAGMKPDLRAECEELLEKFARVDRLDVEVRYRTGALVAMIKADPDRYGKRGVFQLSRALRTDKTTLYDYAKVAETWEWAKVEEQLQRVGINRRPLSFSHLIEIAKEPKESRRKKLIEEVLAEGLTAEQVEARVNNKPSKEGNGASTLPQDVAGVASILRSSVETWRARITHARSQVLPTLRDRPLEPEERAELEAMRTEQQELVNEATEFGAELEALLNTPKQRKERRASNGKKAAQKSARKSASTSRRAAAASKKRGKNPTSRQKAGITTFTADA